MARIQLKRAMNIYPLYVHWAVKIEASLYGQPNLKDHWLWQLISLKEMYTIYHGMCAIGLVTVDIDVDVIGHQMVKHCLHVDMMAL